MAYKCDILLGRITKVSGYEGAVTVKLEKSFSEELPPMESVFLEVEGRPVPFFISGSEYSGAGILKLYFEGYDSPEKVVEFVGCRVFLTSGANANTGDEGSRSLEGYSVLSSEGIAMGSVKEVIENPGQWLLNVVSNSGKSILVPFHEDLIVRIDIKKKFLIMNIPEGLTEIN